MSVFLPLFFQWRKNVCHGYLTQVTSLYWMQVEHIISLFHSYEQELLLFSHSVMSGLQHTGFTALHYLLELAQTHIYWVSDAIQQSHVYHPLLLLPSNFPSIRVFSNESVLHIRWPKYWSFSFSISPSNEYLGLFSFRVNWFDLLAVQRTLKSLLQYHSSKASVLWCSASFMVQLSHSYMTTGKNHSFDYMDLCWQSNASAF